MKKLLFILALSVPVFAQTIDPRTQLNWPRVSGSGSPVSAGFGPDCGAHYGEPYTDKSGPHYWVCTTTGWWQVDGAGGGPTIEVEGSSSGVVQNVIDFNSTNPAAPLNTVNCVWENDPVTGSKSCHVPIPNALQMVTAPPDANQGVFVPFTACSKNPDNVALLVNQYCDARSGYQETIPGGIFNHNAQPSITWSNAVLPSGINPANVTAVYAMTWGAAFNITSVGASCNGSGASNPGFGDPAFSQSTAVMAPFGGGSNIGSITCTMQQSQSVLGAYGATQMAQIGLWVEYTGTPVTSQTAINIGPYLVWNSALNELTTNPVWPNGTHSLTVADMNSLYPPHFNPGFIGTVSDLQAPTGGAVGGGTEKGQVISDGSSYSVYHDTFGIPGGATGVCPSSSDGSLSNLNCNFGTGRVQPVTVNSTLIPFGSGTCGAAITPTAGNALWVYVSATSAAFTVTDTAGDSFSPVYNTSTNLDTGWIATNVVGGATTVTAGSGVNCSGQIYELANVDNTTPIDGTVVTHSATTTPAFYALGNLTTTGGSDLLFTESYGSGCGATGPLVDNYTYLNSSYFQFFFDATAAGGGAYNALWHPGCATSGVSTYSLVAIKGKAGSGGGGGLPLTLQVLAGDGSGGAVATHLDDGHTTAGTITSNEPISVAVAGGAAGAAQMTAGTDAGGAAGTATYTTDATNGYAEVHEGTGALARICTAANASSVTGCQGSGTSVNVNGSSVSNPNFNGTTPAAGSNGKNVTWQVSSSSVSAEIVGDGTASHYLDGTGNYSTPAGGGGGYTNVLGSGSQTTVAQLNTLCSGGTLYATTPLSIATGGTLTCPTQLSGAALWTIAPGQNITFTKLVTETDAPAQHFAGSGTVNFNFSPNSPSPSNTQRAWARWWGALPDNSTDATAAIQACINAGPQICQLETGTYIVSSPLSFSYTNDGVGLVGAVAISDDSTSAHNKTLIKTSSATNDIIDVAGSCPSAPFLGGRFEGLVLRRTVLPSGSAKGMSFVCVGDTVVNRIDSADSIYDYYISGFSNLAFGQISNVSGGFGFAIGGYTSQTLYGMYIDTTSNPNASLYIDKAQMSSNSLSGVTSTGYYLTGPHNADFFCTTCSTSLMTYGAQVVDTAGGGFHNYDIHFFDPIFDANYTACAKVTNALAVDTSAIEFTAGGECTLANSSTYGYDIESSTGVTVTGQQFGQAGSNTGTGIYANSSANLILSNNTFNSTAPSSVAGTAITLNTTTTSSVTGNVAHNTGNNSPTMFTATNTSINNVIISNVWDGPATGMSFDSTSGANNACPNAYGANITTKVTDLAGTNSYNLTNGGSCTGNGLGTVTYTSSQTASGADQGKLVIMNCGSACAYTLPATQPTTTWNARVQSVGSTTATIALGGGDTYNGVATPPVLLKFGIVSIWANSATSTDYKGDTPIVAGSNVTVTPTSNGLTVASTGGGTSGLTQIAQTIVAGTSTSAVTFSAIPGTYSSLRIVMNARASDAANNENVNIQFNGDTGANYDNTYILNNTSSNAQAQTSIQIVTIDAGNSAANQASQAEIMIPAYAATTFEKNLSILPNGYANTTSAGVYATILGAGQWRNTAAITSITLTDNGGGHFIAGSTFTLYGMQ